MKLNYCWLPGGKESACQQRRRRRCGFHPWGWKIPWSRKWQPTPVFLPREYHGQRGLAGCSPQGRKGSDTTEHSHRDGSTGGSVGEICSTLLSQLLVAVDSPWQSLASRCITTTSLSSYGVLPVCLSSPSSFSSKDTSHWI